ncbi:hypothetical protein PybrP1_010945 [[Pythium] brassicae (nom. inval.)]|nr:hypothetical protein PybrP1_010945 [[Pythium] brassicae (nom. inval.)]
MSDSSDEDAGGGAASAMRERVASAARSSTSSTNSLSLSASNVISIIGSSSGGRQKSLFGGMGRVRLREKWGAKPKAAAMAAVTAAAAADADSALRKAKGKLHAASSAPSASLGSSESESEREGDRRRRRALSAVDLERYRTLSAWLEQNGIEVPKQPPPPPPPTAPLALRRHVSTAPTAALVSAAGAVARADAFDDVYDSLETLERAVEREIAQLRPPSPSKVRVAAGASSASVAQCSATRSDTAAALLDYLVVIGPDVTDLAIRNYWHGEANVFEATVAFAWPPESQFNAESIEHFCFPSGVAATAPSRLGSGHAAAAPRESDSFFVLMLAGGGAQGQSVQYASCLKGWITLPAAAGVLGSVAVPVCYCLISELPFLPFFRGVLMQLLDDHRRDLASDGDLSALSSVLSNRHAHHIDEVLQTLKGVALPAAGASMPIDLFPLREEGSSPSLLLLTRPAEETGADEKNTLLLQWSLSHLLACLSIEQTLRILGFLLLEMKVIVVSKSLTLLSSATLGIASLLHPLKWAGPLITVLPPFLHEYLEAPVPLICGVDHLSSAFEFTKGTVVVDLERDKIVVHDDDQHVLSSKPSLPGFAALAQSLSGFTKQLRRGSERSAMTAFPKPHFAVDVVIRRVRRHIESLLDACVSGSASLDLSASNNRSSDCDLLHTFMQSQMYFKYQDDNPGAAAALATPPHDEAVVGKQIPTPASVSPLPLVLKLEARAERLEGWKAAAGVLFHFAMTGVGAMDKREEASASGDATDAAAKLEENNNDIGARNDGMSDKHCDTVAGAHAGDSTHPVRTCSNQSPLGAPLVVKSNASRRTDRDSEAHCCSPSGSPLNSDPQLDRASIPEQNSHSDDVSLVRVRQVRRHQRARSRDVRSSHSHSNSISDNGAFDALDARRSPSDSARFRNNADLSAGYDGLRISLDLQRADADVDAAASLVDSPENEEAADSPETDKSWFSDCSSADGEKTESNGQDSPSCRSDIHAGASTSESECLAPESERLAAAKRLARASSSRKIQRSWRRWRAKPPTVGARSAGSELPPSPRESSRTQSSRSGQQEDRELLTAGVYMQKVRSSVYERETRTRVDTDGRRECFVRRPLQLTKSGEWVEFRLFLSADASCISWKRYASGKRYVLSSVALSDVTHAEFQAAGLDEPQTGEFATVDLCCESKRVCFKYELSPDHIRFVSTLHRRVHAVAVVHNHPAPSTPAHQQVVDATASESTGKVSEFRSLARQSRSSASLLGARDLEKFKLQLQEGFLVEKVRYLPPQRCKCIVRCLADAHRCRARSLYLHGCAQHGRIGQPHVRMLFTDVLCSHLLWKKPQPHKSRADGSGYNRMDALAGRRRTSSSFFQKSLSLASVTAVVAGKQTRVFKRAIARHSDDGCCISVVTPARTLDFRALGQDDFDVLYQGLCSLISESGGAIGY